ncbi:MAG: DeoR/GlpR transcriptional regulator [Actinomycetaceae bacterium]|nr:DeoR/GlpR transcriptional regulator [Actinomycetaceae bacterium]
MARSSQAELEARQTKVVRLLRRGTTDVSELAQVLGVSQATIRRDLVRLEKQGRIARAHGGANRAVGFTEIHLRDRLTHELSAKHAIADVAAAWLPTHGGTVFMDAGSTCAALVANLPRDAELTVVTRGLEIAILLADWPHVRTIVAGGDVAPLSHGLVGTLATDAIRQFRYDVAFLGVDAVDAYDGVGEPTLEEVATKRVAATRASEVVVLADHTKLHRSSVAAWARLETPWTLITDARVLSPACEADVEPFRSAGVRVLIAEQEETERRGA